VQVVSREINGVLWQAVCELSFEQCVKRREQVISVALNGKL